MESNRILAVGTAQWRQVDRQAWRSLTELTIDLERLGLTLEEGRALLHHGTRLTVCTRSGRRTVQCTTVYAPGGLINRLATRMSLV
jgi:hypothetical protein